MTPTEGPDGGSTPREKCYLARSDNFVVQQVLMALQALVHAPQPIRERSHYENRKVWHLIHEKQETLLRDGSQLAMSLGAGGSNPTRPVDQSHFAEDVALRQRLDYLAVQLDLDLAGTDEIHLVALVTLSENYLAGCEANGRRPRMGQKLVTERGAFHFFYLTEKPFVTL